MSSCSSGPNGTVARPTIRFPDRSPSTNSRSMLLPCPMTASTWSAIQPSPASRRATSSSLASPTVSNAMAYEPPLGHELSPCSFLTCFWTRSRDMGTAWTRRALPGWRPTITWTAPPAAGGACRWSHAPASRQPECSLAARSASVRCSPFHLRRPEDRLLVDDDSTARSREEPAEGVRDAQEPGMRTPALIHDVEPVPVAVVARLGPLVLAELDVPHRGASLDLDSSLLVFPLGQEVEAGVLGEPCVPGETRCVHVPDGCPTGLLVAPRDSHGNLLHFLVVALAVLGVCRGDHQGVREEGYLAGRDEVGLAAQDPERLPPASVPPPPPGAPPRPMGVGRACSGGPWGGGGWGGAQGGNPVPGVKRKGVPTGH